MQIFLASITIIDVPTMSLMVSVASILQSITLVFLFFLANQNRVWELTYHWGHCFTTPSKYPEKISAFSRFSQSLGRGRISDFITKYKY